MTALLLAGALALVPSDSARVLEEVRRPGAEAVLVNVWATWCTPCREEMPDLVRIHRRWKDRGFRLVLAPAPADFAEEPLALAASAPMADVNLRNVDGSMLSIADAKGIGVIAIDANDPAVQAEDSYEAMQARAKEKGRNYPYVVDDTSDVARAFGATKTPELFLFDAEGKLVCHGAPDDNVKDAAQVKETWLADALAAVAKGKIPATQRTKALGCSIKFRNKS